jgi:hypothetical protein
MTNIHTLNSGAAIAADSIDIGNDAILSKRGWHKKATLKDLHEMLRQSGLTHQATCAFGWWPTLENSCVELMMHLGCDRLRIDSVAPLSHVTIRSSVRSFDLAYEQTGKIDIAVRRFLDAFLEAADQLTTHKIYAEVGAQKLIWEPFRQPYDSWIRDVGIEAKVKVSGSYFIFEDELLTARRMLAAITLSKTDFNLAFESGV